VEIKMLDLSDGKKIYTKFVLSIVVVGLHN
jgi:hypothetical protein